MTCVEEALKKQVRAVDLAVAAGRKRQSPRTGFIHLFLNDETASDTIPIYENFCFALALFRLKTGDAVLEGKSLIERLLAFQAPCGNFPIYLHDFPKCWDPLNPLKIAPVFLLLIRHFDAVLGVELKDKIESSLNHLLGLAQKRRLEKSYAPLWENRFLACMGMSLVDIDSSLFSAIDWSEWVTTLTIAERSEKLSIPYNPTLESFIGMPPLQEKGEPRPSPIEWILAESSQKFSSQRLLRDHPDQIYCAMLYPVLFAPSSTEPDSFYCGADGTFRLLWKGSSLHSLAAQASQIKFTGNQAELFFDLSEEMAVCRDDLFEASLYCDFSSETQVFVDHRKATLFQLGSLITIQTPGFSLGIRFELIQGEGDFCGHLYRGNRPSQPVCKGPRLYEAYDWKIGLRTLRRKAPCQIRVTLVRNREKDD